MNSFSLFLSLLIAAAPPLAAALDDRASSPKPGATTTNPANPGAPISPGTVNTGEPNAGSTPAPGMGAGGIPGSTATPNLGSSSESISSNWPQGPGDPSTEMQRSTALEISFVPGKFVLAEEEKQKIDNLMNGARARGQIAEVKVVAWADVGYPEKDKELSDVQKMLAEKRNQALQSYIGSRYNNLRVNTYNMAERPSVLAELIKSSDARTKNSLESAGLAGDGANRASKALVLAIVR